MCCWGDGQSSGQESGGDRKAWHGCVQDTEQGPSEPLLCCLMKTALAGAEGQRGRGSWLASVSMEAQEASCLGSAGEPASWIQDLQKSSSVTTDRAPSGALTLPAAAGTMTELLFRTLCSESSSACDSLCKPGKSLNLSGPQTIHV